MSSKQNKKFLEWKEWCKVVQSATTINIKESEAEKQKRIKRGKKDIKFVVSYYFPHYATDEMGDFQVDACNTIKKDNNIFAVLEWAREHAKSVYADVIIPMWLIMNGELFGMILVGKNNDDACNLLSDIQAELENNQRFINDFGEQMKSGSWVTGEFVTNEGIQFIALGRGQSPRGIRHRERRPNYCVVDDLDDDEIVNNPDRVEKVVNWILGSLYGAMDIRASRFVMVGNRIDQKSILAHIVGDIDENTPKRDGIYHSKVCATQDGTFTGEPSWWQKYTKEHLQERFKRMGYFMAMREYFHKAIKKGKIFRAEWIHWGRMLQLRSYDHIVAYFDPSYKPKTSNDFKAVKVWGKKGLKLHNLEAFVKQTTVTEAIKWMYDYYESLPEDVIVDFYMEEVFLQDMFYDDFELEAQERGYYLPIKGDTRKKPDKFMRIQALTPLWERGFVTYNIARKKDSHMRTGIDQTLGFQKGASIHDDAPDADEGAIWILQNRGRQDKFPGKIGKRKRNRAGW
jgi:hypothetical protein